MVQLRPEQLLCHVRVPYLVGVRKSVGTRADGATDPGERSAEELQRITNIIEADRVRELRVEHRHQMAPGCELPGLLIYPSFFGYLGHQERRNEIANLAEDLELVSALE